MLTFRAAPFSFWGAPDVSVFETLVSHILHIYTSFAFSATLSNMCQRGVREIWKDALPPTGSTWYYALNRDLIWHQQHSAIVAGKVKSCWMLSDDFQLDTVNTSCREFQGCFWRFPALKPAKRNVSYLFQTEFRLLLVVVTKGNQKK